MPIDIDVCGVHSGAVIESPAKDLATAGPALGGGHHAVDI
jgi:hypothetical protein